MLTQQELFNKACQSLKDYGNPYGSQGKRGWGFVNPNDHSQRCAIAQFISGNSCNEVYNNLKKEIGCNTHEEIENKYPVIMDIMQLFDYESIVCNDKLALEIRLQHLADKYGLSYSPTQNINLTQISETQIPEIVLG